MEMRPSWQRMCLVAMAMVAVIAGFALLSQCGEASVVIDHDLDVTTSQTLAGDTYEVHGNVTVRPGATLTLTRCSLVVVGTGNGTHLVDVSDGAALVTDNATIRGAPHTIGVHLPGGCSLTTTVVEHIEAANASRGLWLRGGDTWMDRVTVRDCPNNTAVLVMSNLTARDCAFSALGTRGVQLGTTDWPIAVRLGGCSFAGGAEPMAGAIGLHIAWNTSAAQRGTVTVTGCVFTGLPVGLHAQPNSTDVRLVLGSLWFLNCMEGLVVSGNRADVTVADCAVEAIASDVGIGLYVPYSAYPPMELAAFNLSASGCERGIYVRGPAVDFYPRLPRLDVRDCTYGVAVQGCAVEVVDSTVLDCDYCFEAEWHGHIDVRRTDHEHMSARVATGEEGAIVAYSTLNVTYCGWRNAGPIASGTVYIFGEDGQELERLDSAALAPVEVVAWAKSRWNLIGRLRVVPAHFAQGVRFEAANFSVYNTSAQRVEIIDNRTPGLTDVVLNDHEWGYINTSTLKASGRVVELGTGLSGLVASLEGVEDRAVAVAPDGNWSVSFGPLADGEYNLSLAATDLSGNVGGPPPMRIAIDTVIPTIALAPSWHELWNLSFVVVEGWTDASGEVRFGAQVRPVYGLIQIGDEFPDGEHIEPLTVEDWAGNTAHMMVRFTVDTVPPSVVITAPADGSWSGTGLVTVVGLADVGASLWVNGEDVPRAPGEQGFSHAVSLGEGDITVVARVVDAANNSAEAAVLVRVDLTAPVLTILEPASDRVVTVEDTVVLKAEVDDANLASVQLDGLEVAVLDGFLARTLPVADGTNVFRLVAADLAGNRAERTITVLRDITPPTAQHSIECAGGRLVRAGEETVATAPRLDLTITPSEWVRATINGALGLAEGGGPLVFGLALDEGPNVFTVLIEDEAGLKGASIVVRVTLDTTAPAITVAEPLDGARVGATTARVVGSVEPGSALEVMGRAVTVAGDGSFNVQLPLARGENLIIVHATDRVGLESYVNLTVTRVEEEEDSPGPGAAAAILSLVATACALPALRARRRR